MSSKKKADHKWKHLQIEVFNMILKRFHLLMWKSSTNQYKDTDYRLGKYCSDYDQQKINISYI